MSSFNDNGSTAFPGNDSQRSFPRLGLKKNDPGLDALLGKLVSNTEQGGRPGRTQQTIRAPDQGLLQKVSDTTGQSATDAKNLLQVLPDVELSMLILISSILSPKDLVHTELTFKVDQTLFNSELTGQLLQPIREHFEAAYNITDLLPEILKDALFMTGSYGLAVLPETTIDDIINSPSRVSMESLSSEFLKNDIYPLGFLGNVPAEPKEGEEGIRLGMESLAQMQRARDPRAYSAKVTPPASVMSDAKNPRLPKMLDYVTVVDNPNVLKLPHLRDKMRQDSVQDALSTRKMSMEAYGREEDPANTSFYRRRRYKSAPIVSAKTPSLLERSNVGHPLAMHLPSEAIIPVHVPGSPEDHIGYFILLDENGNPLSRVEESNYYRDLTNALSTNNQQSSNLLQAARTGFTGRNDDLTEEFKRLDETYAGLMEAELQNRLRFGLYGSDAEVSKNHEVYRIMLARALAKMHTQVLYLPEELMTYIAFDYNAHGVGISLLEKSKILGSLRSTLMFANTMASIKNSLGRTVLNISLEPEDPDPSSTVEFLINEYVKNTRSQMPVGITNPSDIITSLQNGGLDIVVTNNPRYPETKLDVEDKQSNRAKPDTELEESIRKRHIMAMSLSPEMVDNSMGAEFATSVVQNNLLLSKRVMMYQKGLTTGVSDHIRKYTLNSQTLMQSLREVLKKNMEKLQDTQKQELIANIKAISQSMRRGVSQSSYTMGQGGLQEAITDRAIDRLLVDFVTAMYVTLPDPDLSTLENQFKAYTAYTEALEKALEAYIDGTFMDTNMGGEVAEVTENIKAALKAHFQRQWLRENNMFAELETLVTLDDDGTPGMDLSKIVANHTEGLQKTILSYAQELMAARKKTDAAYTAAKDAAGVTMGDTGGSIDDGGGDTAFSDDDAGGGFPDLDAGGNIGSDVGDIATDATDDASESGDQSEVVEESESSSKTETSEDGQTTTTSETKSSSSTDSTS